MGRTVLRPLRGASLVAVEGFGDYLLERDVFFYGEFAAVVEFGRGVQDAAIDAGKLDANVAESRGNADGFARQDAALAR